MGRFSDIVGQKELKDYLQNAIRTDMVSHAYIIHGERNSGKEFLAKVFAKALQCENRDDAEPCGKCHSCIQAQSMNHPDIIFVTHEKPNVISVEDVRNQINSDVAIKPYQGPKKIYIVNDAELMTVQAQNALLKTIEEPPEYVVIMLLTSNVDVFLPTILSRCISLQMKPAKDEEIKEFLMRTMQIPDYKAQICVAFARGNTGKARLLAKSEEFDKAKDEALSLLKNINDMDVGDLTLAVKRFNEYKFDVNDYLDIFLIWYRDMLLFKATHDANGLIFREELPSIRKAADKSTYEGIETIIQAIEKCKARLQANVNFDLSMELLLLSIKEN
ncbi:MAG: DNA polymerase III subunit delta' [Lachnospiraceae bacterium]|nr:DNA polymerase III subunit delta' [Lachnospiraceae bacterium]